MNIKFSAKSTYFLFFFSGISGLIYEIVWLRILIRVLGSTVYATSVILAAFMTGLAIGSLVTGSFGDKINHRLRFFSLLEFLTGISAILLFFLFPLLTPLYKIIYKLAGESRFALTIFQSCLMLLILLIPTSLMGGTLPILVSHTKKYQVVFSQRLGYLYGLNTLGAFLGVLASGIYLIGAVGETNTLFIGVLISLAVALTAYSLSKKESDERLLNEPVISRMNEPANKAILFAYALSGFTAISYEIIWTRIFQIYVGTSIYSFSLMLAFYLLGIAMGSTLGVKLFEKMKHPLLVFGSAQLLIAFYSVAGLFIFTVFEPASFSQFEFFGLGGIIPLLLMVVFPITFILGFIFPLISKCYVKNESRSSLGVGRLYSANTAGCILGSLVTGFLLIGIFGTRGVIIFLAVLNILIGLAMIYHKPSSFFKLKYNFPVAIALIVIFIFCAASPDPFMSAVNKSINKFYRDYTNDLEIFYHRESVAATTTVFGVKNQPLMKQLWINGIGMTSLVIETKIMAHLPLLLHPNPKNLLVVCFGMGTTLRSAWTHRSINCDAVELVPEVYECFKYFHPDGNKILADPRVKHYVDDGRSFLETHSKKYDVITMDPAPPVYSAGTVNLYTQEFFRLCRDHLTANGIMTVWVPPDKFSETIMIMKTFQSVFPNASVWGGPVYPGIYLVGHKSPKKPDLSRFYKENNNKAIIADLNQWSGKKRTAVSLLGLLVLNPAQLSLFVSGVNIITDDRPYTEFPLWRALLDKTYTLNFDAISLSNWRKNIFK